MASDKRRAETHPNTVSVFQLQYIRALKGLPEVTAHCSLCGICRARISAGFHARVILDGAACRLGDLGDVHDELGVLGGDRVVQIVLRVLVSW